MTNETLDAWRDRALVAESYVTRLRAERNADWSETELGRIADDLDEDNNATDAAYVRAAASALARLERECASYGKRKRAGTFADIVNAERARGRR